MTVAKPLLITLSFYHPSWLAAVVWLPNSPHNPEVKYFISSVRVITIMTLNGSKCYYSRIQSNHLKCLLPMKDLGKDKRNSGISMNAFTYCAHCDCRTGLCWRIYMLQLDTHTVHCHHIDTMESKVNPSDTAQQTELKESQVQAGHFAVLLIKSLCWLSPYVNG